MYISDINGRKIIYYNDRLELDDLAIYYKDMRHITQSFGDTPVFRFEYNGRNLRVPCKDDEYEIVLEYFRMAADAAPKSDPLEFLSDDDFKSDNYSSGSGRSVYEDLSRKDNYRYTSSSEGSNSYRNYSKHTYSSSGSGSRNNNYSYQSRTTERWEDRGSYKSINKNVFVWVFSFLLGSFGVDRFVRGQIAIGIIKLFVCLISSAADFPFGVWALIDWIIAMYKAYGVYKGEPNLEFGEKGRYLR